MFDNEPLSAGQVDPDSNHRSAGSCWIDAQVSKVFPPKQHFGTKLPPPPQFICLFPGVWERPAQLRVHVEEMQSTTIEHLFLEITLNKLGTEAGAVGRGRARLDDHLALAVSLTPNWYPVRFFPLNNSLLYCQTLLSASHLGRKALCCKHQAVSLITVAYLC